MPTQTRMENSMTTASQKLAASIQGINLDSIAASMITTGSERELEAAIETLLSTPANLARLDKDCEPLADFFVDDMAEQLHKLAKLHRWRVRNSADAIDGKLDLPRLIAQAEIGRYVFDLFYRDACRIANDVVEAKGLNDDYAEDAA